MGFVPCYSSYINVDITLSPNCCILLCPHVQGCAVATRRVSTMICMALTTGPTPSNKPRTNSPKHGCKTISVPMILSRGNFMTIHEWVRSCVTWGKLIKLSIGHVFTHACPYHKYVIYFNIKISDLNTYIHPGDVGSCISGSTRCVSETTRLFPREYPRWGENEIDILMILIWKWNYMAVVILRRAYHRPVNSTCLISGCLRGTPCFTVSRLKRPHRKHIAAVLKGGNFTVLLISTSSGAPLCHLVSEPLIKYITCFCDVFTCGTI